MKDALELVQVWPLIEREASGDGTFVLGDSILSFPLSDSLSIGQANPPQEEPQEKVDPVRRSEAEGGEAPPGASVTGSERPPAGLLPPSLVLANLTDSTCREKALTLLLSLLSLPLLRPRMF